MITYALLAFAIAAIGGLVLASQVLRAKLASWPLSLLHAALGATGLLLLIVVLLQGGAPPRILVGFVLLLVAALGGFFLASFHPRIPEGPALRDTYLHMGTMIVAFMFFTLRLLLRLDHLQPLAPDGLSLLLDAGGFLALVAGGWLGARLVYGHGIVSRSSAGGSVHPRKGDRKTPAGT